MTNDRLELLGVVLVIAFFAVVWWPSALLVAGLAAIAVATIRDREVKPDSEEPQP